MAGYQEIFSSMMLTILLVSVERVVALCHVVVEVGIVGGGKGLEPWVLPIADPQSAITVLSVPSS